MFFSVYLLPGGKRPGEHLHSLPSPGMSSPSVLCMSLPSALHVPPLLVLHLQPGVKFLPARKPCLIRM